LKKVLITVFSLLLLSSLVVAGTGRKVLKTAQPSYPALARQMHLSGTVRIEAKVNTSGHITDLKVVGGHPVLSAPAADAARKFVYEPAPTDTVESISFNFVPAE
jgi:TonB family protein